MPMPLNLVLVRHGESELNEANARSRQGDNSLFTEDFRNRHDSQFRLTSKGVYQAQAAGIWIRDKLPFVFDRFYVSEYVRAMETAALLNIPQANWFADFNLREREWGELGVIPQDERQVKYAEALRQRKIDSFYWRPPNGESIAQLCLRINRILGTLDRECSDKNVIIVCHGEVMWAFRVALERLSQYRYAELDAMPEERIHNCQVMHYTRIDPITGKTNRYYNNLYSVCPWDVASVNSADWKKIIRPTYSNEDLLETVNRFPRLIG